MKSLVITGPKKVELVTENMNNSLQPDEVLVRVKYISLCGSDYKLFKGLYSGPKQYPLKFGHEWSGIVKEIGNQVESVKCGDYVTGDCSIWCGTCIYCLSDKNLCLNIKKYGITTDGFSQTFKIVNKKYLYAASKDLLLPVVGLAEPFAVVYHALNKLCKIIPSVKWQQNRILIIGCGMLGLAAYLLLTLQFQCKQIDICDNMSEKVDYLQSLFTDMQVSRFELPHFNRNKNETYTSLYADCLHDIVIDATGLASGVSSALSFVKPGGCVVSFSMFDDAIINFKQIILKSVTVLGSIGGTGAFQQALLFFEKYQSYVKSIITHCYSLDQAADAFMDKHHNNGMKIKSQIRL